MAGAKNHDYHILPPDIWPIVGAFSALTMTSGMVFYMHKAAGGGTVALVGLFGVALTMFSWWGKVIKEAHEGHHTPVVQLHQRYGMILFIASEVMFFVGWFWAFFDFSLFPNKIAIDVIGGQWPPKAITSVMNALDLPLLNTLILLCSGTTLTWAHHALINGERVDAKRGLWATIVLGLMFSAIQAYEYMHAPFAFGKNTYGSSFYMATGFHGFHVIVGSIFLIICLIRVYQNHFTPRQHFGFEAAAWYWHFVDVVWLFLFVAIYVWGNWGATIE
jgi:cytochrome c oxidase subunit 3